MDAHFPDVVQLEARQFPPLLPTNILPPLPPLVPPTPPPPRPISTSSTSTSTVSTSISSETSTTPSTTTSSTVTSSTPTTSSSISSEAETSTITAPNTTHTVTNGPTTPTGSVIPPPASTPTGFLQNKALSGVVFAIVGLVGLVLLIMIGTFFIRRRRNKKLFAEAINFDPVSVGNGNYAEALEAGQGNEKIRTSSSSAGAHGDASWTTMPMTGYTQQYAFTPAQPPPPQHPGQPYAPPPSWGAPRYAPPSQLYRPQDMDTNYPGTNVPPGY